MIPETFWARAEKIHVHHRPEAMPVMKARILEVTSDQGSGFKWLSKIFYNAGEFLQK